MKKNEIIQLLKMGIATVRFTKLDTTERIMNCTLDPSRIPVTIKENKEEKRKKPENLVVAWDVDKQGWRSFRSENVISASLLES